MSMAGIIDMDAIATGATIYKKQRELKALFSERKKQEEDIALLEQKVEITQKEISQLQTDLSAERQKRQLACEAFCTGGRDRLCFSKIAAK